MSNETVIAPPSADGVASDATTPMCWICHRGAFEVGDGAEGENTGAEVEGDGGSRSGSNTPDAGEELVSDRCLCRGAFATVHLTCITQWVVQGRHSRCHMCGLDYNIINPPPTSTSSAATARWAKGTHTRTEAWAVYALYFRTIAVLLLQLLGAVVRRCVLEPLLTGLLVLGSSLISWRALLITAMDTMAARRWVDSSGATNGNAGVWWQPHRNASYFLKDWGSADDAFQALRHNGTAPLDGIPAALIEALICGLLVRFTARQETRAWTVFADPQAAERVAAVQRDRHQQMRALPNATWCLRLLRQWQHDWCKDKQRWARWKWELEACVALLWGLLGPLPALAIVAGLFCLPDYHEPAAPPILLEVDALANTAVHNNPNNNNMMRRAGGGGGDWNNGGYERSARATGRQWRRGVERLRRDQAGTRHSFVLVRGTQYAFLQRELLCWLHVGLGPAIVGLACHMASAELFSWHLQLAGGALVFVESPPPLLAGLNAMGRLLFRQQEDGGWGSRFGNAVVFLFHEWFPALWYFYRDLRMTDLLGYWVVGAAVLLGVTHLFIHPVMGQALSPRVVQERLGFFMKHPLDMASGLNRQVLLHWVRGNALREQLCRSGRNRQQQQQQHRGGTGTRAVENNDDDDAEYDDDGSRLFYAWAVDTLLIVFPHEVRRVLCRAVVCGGLLLVPTALVLLARYVLGTTLLTSLTSGASLTITDGSSTFMNATFSSFPVAAASGSSLVVLAPLWQASGKQILFQRQLQSEASFSNSSSFSIRSASTLLSIYVAALHATVDLLPCTLCGAQWRDTSEAAQGKEEGRQEEGKDRGGMILELLAAQERNLRATIGKEGEELAGASVTYDDTHAEQKEEEEEGKGNSAWLLTLARIIVTQRREWAPVVMHYGFHVPVALALTALITARQMLWSATSSLVAEQSPEMLFTAAASPLSSKSASSPFSPTATSACILSSSILSPTACSEPPTEHQQQQRTYMLSFVMVIPKRWPLVCAIAAAMAWCALFAYAYPINLYWLRAYRAVLRWVHPSSFGLPLMGPHRVLCSAAQWHQLNCWLERGIARHSTRGALQLPPTRSWTDGFMEPMFGIVITPVTNHVASVARLHAFAAAQRKKRRVEAGLMKKREADEKTRRNERREGRRRERNRENSNREHHKQQQRHALSSPSILCVSRVKSWRQQLATRTRRFRYVARWVGYHVRLSFYLSVQLLVFSAYVSLPFVVLVALFIDVAPVGVVLLLACAIMCCCVASPTTAYVASAVLFSCPLLAVIVVGAYCGWLCGVLALMFRGDPGIAEVMYNALYSPQQVVGPHPSRVAVSQ